MYHLNLVRGRDQLDIKGKLSKQKGSDKVDQAF